MAEPHRHQYANKNMRIMEESVLYTLQVMRDGDFSLSNECSDSPFWHEWYPRLRFAFFVIFMVYYIFGMPALFWWARRRSEAAKRMLQWHTYPVAVAFMSLYLLLAVIAEGLFDCKKVNSLKYLKIWIAANVFRYLANVIILYIILFPIVNRMMKHARWEGHPIIGHWILIAFVTIFMILFVIMWNYNLIHGLTGQKTTDPNYGVEATYVTLYLAAALYTAGHLMSARIQAMRIKASGQGMIPWCPLLPIGLIGFALMDFIVIFAYYVVDRVYTKSASSTFVILGLFFQAFMYLSVPFIASSKALGDEEAERQDEQEALHAGNTNDTQTHETQV